MLTKGEIDRLGKRIGASTVVSSDDMLLLQEYRQTFKDPISRVFSFVIESARKIDRQCIVTYRIKRIDTIMEKLRRYQGNENGSMNLSRMWDIAGCRCILNSSNQDKLYQLQKVILKEFGQDSKINDHIANPKDSGYRSLHIYVKDKETQKPVEIQIRNKEQHNWATLVEIVDLLYGTKNKEQGASGPLGRFLFLFSNAKNLSDEEFSEMLQIERKKKVFEKMSGVLSRNYINIRRQWLKQKTKGGFFVITANKKSSKIESYRSFEEAEAVYYKKYLANQDANIVLTHLRYPDFEQISMAYSNYVLAMHAFFDDYRVLLSEKIIECIKEERYVRFMKCFHVYNSNVRCHFENLSLEINSIKDCEKDASISKNQINNWVREIKTRIALWFKETNDFLNSLGRVTERYGFKEWIVKNRIRSLGKAISKGQKKFSA